MDQGHSRILQLLWQLARTVLCDYVSRETCLKDSCTITINAQSVDIVNHAWHLSRKLCSKSRSPLVAGIRLLNISFPCYKDDVAGQLSERADELPHLIR